MPAVQGHLQTDGYVKVDGAVCKDAILNFVFLRGYGICEMRLITDTHVRTVCGSDQA